MPRTKGAKDKKPRVRKSTKPTKVFSTRVPKQVDQSIINKIKLAVKDIINKWIKEENAKQKRTNRNIPKLLR